MTDWAWDDHIPSGVHGMDGYDSVWCACGWDSETSKLGWVEHIRAMGADDLGAAWAEAEAALPEGCTLALYWQLGLWNATYSHKHTECPDCGMLHQCEPERETINWPSTGPTPAAALRALAAQLRKRAG